MNTMRDITAYIGQRLREARHRQGWSQVELAAKAGVSQGTISRLESARHHVGIDLETLIRVTRALQITVFDVLDFELRPSERSAQHPAWRRQ